MAAALMLFVSCHTITEDLPTEPTEATEATQHVGAITIPIILGTTPTPAPNPTPTATAPPPGSDPTPTPPPPPPGGGGGGGGGTCHLGGGDPNHRCSRTSQTFLRDVDAAMTAVIEAQPELFNLRDDVCGGCPKILDHHAYVEAVERELQRMGYCAHYDGEEMAVKNIQAFNDQYDTSTSSGYVRRGDKIYRSTCRPAWF